MSVFLPSNTRQECRSNLGCRAYSFIFHTKWIAGLLHILVKVVIYSRSYQVITPSSKFCTERSIIFLLSISISYGLYICQAAFCFLYFDTEKHFLEVSVI